jgi:hypothetical protein
MSVFFFWYLGFRSRRCPLSLSPVPPIAGAPSPSRRCPLSPVPPLLLAGAPSRYRRCPLSLSPVPPSSPPSSHRRRALHRFRTHIIRSTIYTVHVDAYIINIRSLARIQLFNYMEIDQAIKAYLVHRPKHNVLPFHR